ncbi:tetratricopeptide repeat protein [Desulfatitalea tepidiphila]|uniref:tetratricopeptide repeat protein n=1 Tax=Desulfatitalea tepidiphila TaxID=1185843 RepID=UPI0006B5B417|nr:tetratricopeptide repeat protein [Desulfatitalea tepidiphila]
MAGKKITRKELVKKPDEFLTLTGKVVQWARANAKPLAYGIGAFFVFLILVAGYRLYSENRERAAAALLSRGMTAYAEAVKAGNSPAEALAAAEPELQRLVDGYGRYDAGRLAGVFLAHISLSANMPDQAIALYSEALDRLEGHSSLGNTILNGLAMAYLQKGDASAAIEAFEKVLASGSTVLKDNALFQLGQLYRTSGDGAKSRQTFERLAADFPNSIYVDIARETAAATEKIAG